MVLISSSLRALCRPQAVLSAPWDSKEPAVGVHCHLCKITCAPSVRCAPSVVHHHLDAHHQHCLCTTGSNCAPLVVHHRHNTTAGPHAGAAVGWVDGTVVGWGALCCVGVTRGLFVVLCPSWCHTGALCCVVLVPHGGSLLCWCHTGALCCVVVTRGLFVVLCPSWCHPGSLLCCVGVTRGHLLCCVGVTRGLFVVLCPSWCHPQSPLCCVGVTRGHTLVLVSPVVTAVFCWCHTGSHSGVGVTCGHRCVVLVSHGVTLWCRCPPVSQGWFYWAAAGFGAPNKDLQPSALLHPGLPLRPPPRRPPTPLPAQPQSAQRLHCAVGAHQAAAVGVGGAVRPHRG